ncbi:MAG: helix-hairpin-helix domain-containing protein, partial [Solirubrobacterales bacterium]
MRNAEIAAALRELGILYELDGADRFRVLAYKDAAKVAADSPVSLEQLSADGRLTDLPGFGKTLAVKVEALIETGSIPAADKLKQKFPASLVEVTRVPGLGAKKVRRLHDELGVTDLESLRAAAEQEQIREMNGFGAKVEERVIAALETLPAAGDESERRLLSKVLPVAEQLAAALEGLPEAGRVAVAGSARRWAETCKDIDIIATSDDPVALGKALAEHELVAQASAAGEKGTSVMTHAGIKVDLRITPEATFGNLLQHFTGSMEHNVQLRERALKRGLSVSEHGVTETEVKGKRKPKVHRYTDEAGVYELLGLAYIEPELREGRGEIDAADSGELPELVRIEDLKGDLHSHTTLSDGRNSLEEMAAAARKRGYAYLAITDHSASHGFGNDVTAKQLS